MPGLRHLERAVFRSSPNYELRPPGELAGLAEFAVPSEIAGILLPQQQQQRTLGSAKALCADTTRLFESLAEPGHVPVFASESHGDRLNTELAKLVLDDVLEIEHEGAFRSSIAAWEAIFEGTDLETYGSDQLTNRISRLSMEALRYGEVMARHGVRDFGLLAARLYFFNRQPASPKWLHALPNRAAVEAHLGWSKVGRGSRNPTTGERDESPWLTWQRHSEYSPYKLFVSPQCSAIGTVFPVAVGILTASRCSCFKIGADAYGLLRPDKFVAYFHRFEHLLAVAEALRSQLQGTPVQGVPFSSQLDDRGLLSWGVDPEPSAYGIVGESESWRTWITQRLAAALIAAVAAPDSPVEPWRFALARLALEGVDLETWELQRQGIE